MEPMNKVLTFPGPSGWDSANDYQVFANGLPLFLYQARVNFIRIPDKDLFPELTPFAYFCMEGEVEISITANRKVDFVDIRPKSYEVKPLIDGQTIRFKLDQPRKLTIEINGDLHRALHLFANPFEQDTPDPSDPNVRYFGPGVHEVGVINLASDQTIYLAGGAYVYGIVRGDNVDNSSVRGYGILSAEKAPWPDGAFQVINCRSLELRDIILLDSAGWSVKIDGCEDVKITNLKEICYRRNCDGIDLCSTRNAVVSDCFIRNWDDAICVKGLNNGDARDITITGCILWSDAAQSIEIGYETQMERLENIVVKNIDILHHLMPGYMCLTVHNGDRAQVSGLRFEDIRIEDSVTPVFDVWVGKANWNRDESRGRVRDVVFKNITLIGGHDTAGLTHLSQPAEDESALSPLAALTNRVSGYDADHDIENVTFEHINLLGKFVGQPEAGNFQINQYARNVKFIPPSNGDPILNYATTPDLPVAAPCVIRFDASGSYGQGAALTAYHWDFGEGHQAEGAVTCHSFDKAGNYTMRLTVMDVNGRKSSILRVLPILPYHEAVEVIRPELGLRTRFGEGDFNFASDINSAAVQGGELLTTISTPRKLRHDYHALVYEGLIKIPVDGIYRFCVGMSFSTGYDMLAGGLLVIHDQVISANNNGWGAIGLRTGFHPIRMQLFRKSGARDVEFKIMGPGIHPQPMPSHFLYHEAGE